MVAADSIPGTSRTAKAIATTIARGETLFADGYTIEPYADRPGVYAVYPPAEKPRGKGDSLWHDVDVINQECSCPAFEHLGKCKHLVATNKAVADAVRLVAPMLPESRPDPAPAGVAPGRFATHEDFLTARAADFA